MTMGSSDHVPAGTGGVPLVLVGTQLVGPDTAGISAGISITNRECEILICDVEEGSQSCIIQCMSGA